MSDYTVQPKDKDELIQIIEDTIKKEGRHCNLNFIDTSLITDMCELFDGSDFDGDISEWDTSNVTDMWAMFYNSSFNQDISKWNTHKVKNMTGMFKNSPLEDKHELQPKFN